MARLIACMLQSLDGYTADQAGDFSWAMPDEEVHQVANDLDAGVGTYLYGRKMYDVMVFWETADQDPDAGPVFKDFARGWQAKEKIVYSTTMTEPRSARTRIEPRFDAEAVRRLKAAATKDLAIAGPTLAAEALRAGLVDELQLLVFPVVVGGGTRFLPDGVKLKLELLEERRFASGVVLLRYAVAG